MASEPSAASRHGSLRGKVGRSARTAVTRSTSASAPGRSARIPSGCFGTTRAIARRRDRSPCRCSAATLRALRRPTERNPVPGSDWRVLFDNPAGNAERERSGSSSTERGKLVGGEIEAPRETVRRVSRYSTDLLGASRGRNLREQISAIPSRSASRICGKPTPAGSRIVTAISLDFSPVEFSPVELRGIFVRRRPTRRYGVRQSFAGGERRFNAAHRFEESDAQKQQPLLVVACRLLGTVAPHRRAPIRSRRG
jgi:hypothetical protein